MFFWEIPSRNWCIFFNFVAQLRLKIKASIAYTLHTGPNLLKRIPIRFLQKSGGVWCKVPNIPMSNLQVFNVYINPFLGIVENTRRTFWVLG